MHFAAVLLTRRLNTCSVQHTSASLTINENYDSDVQDDTETFLNRIVPEVRYKDLFSDYWSFVMNCI